MVSLAAVAGLDVPVKLVACIGFGIDAYHGVNHVQVLENIAGLDRDGAYLGAFTIPGASNETRLYRDAVAHAQHATPTRPSIVNGHIAAAIRGAFGDVQFTTRTSGSPLFVNPLMAMYFTFDLVGLAKHSLYLERLERTVTIRQISKIIEEFRAEITPQSRRGTRTDSSQYSPRRRGTSVHHDLPDGGRVAAHSHDYSWWHHLRPPGKDRRGCGSG